MEKQTTQTVVPNYGDIDIEKYRLPQNFGDVVSLKKVITTIPVHKPRPQAFVRVHPAPEYCIQTAVLEIKEDSETYLVDPSLFDVLAEEITPKALFTAITKQGNLFIWPVKLPTADGKIDKWSQSALEAVNYAKEGWIRMKANRDGGYYDVLQAPPGQADPVWPELSFSDVLNVAFRDFNIKDYNHPVLRKLRGEI